MSASFGVSSREKLLVFTAALGQSLALVAFLSLLQVRLRKRWARLALSGFATLYAIACWMDYGAYSRARYHSFRFIYDQLTFTRHGIRQVVTIIDRTGIPPAVSIALFAFFFSTPLLGIVFHRLGEKIARRWPREPSSHALRLGLAIGLALMITPSLVTRGSERHAYLRALYKIIPFPVRLSSVPPGIVKLPVRLRPLRPEADVAKRIDDLEVPTAKRFPIFLFVFESLREDFLTDDVAPTFAAFRRESVRFSRTVAAANGTVPAMYAMLHGNEGLYWLDNQIRDDGKGSPALRALKKLGYRVTTGGLIWTSEFDPLLYGRDNYLRDRKIELMTEGSQADVDGDMMRRLIALTDGVRPDSAELFLAFVNTTHFAYSWPRDFKIKFTPVMGELFYMNYSPEQIEMGKNRYRNAINYVDTLLADSFKTLRERGLWDDSLVIVASDHGEELWDHGLIGHTSELCNAQTLIPLYYKFPRGFTQPRKAGSLGTAVDIMPTILGALGADVDGKGIFDGRPIWKGDERVPVTVFHNSVRPPLELTLRDGEYKLFLTRDKSRLEDFYIERVTDAEDRPFIPGRGEPEDYLAFAENRFAISRHPLFH